MLQAFFCDARSVLLGRPEGNDKVSALRIAGVADIVMVSGADESDVAGIHLARDAIDSELALALLHEPELVVFVCFIGLVQRADLLDGFMAFELDIAGCQHAEQITVRLALG